MCDKLTPGSFDDIFFAPISLKKLSANAVSLEVWRREVNEYRHSRILETFDPYHSRKSLDWMEPLFPDVSPTIYDMIAEPAKRFGCSMNKWLSAHYEGGLRFHYGHKNLVLADFDNFVCSYNGGIDFLKTAESMVKCERFNTLSKFVIACMYFFEDHVEQIWPFLSKKMAFEGLTFDKCPQLFYWICRLKNKMELIPVYEDRTTDEIMFDSVTRLRFNRIPMDYFWNRIPLEKRSYWAEVLLARDIESFVRFVLPNLRNEQPETEVFRSDISNNGYFVIEKIGSKIPIYHLDKFILKNYVEIIWLLECDDERCIRATWLCIVENMSENAFSAFILKMLTVKGVFGKDRTFENLWNLTYSNRMKGAVISRVLYSSKYLEDIKKNSDISVNSQCHELNVENLLIILQSVAFTERRLFWQRCSSSLKSVVKPEDFETIRDACHQNSFENQRALLKRKRVPAVYH